MILIDDHEVTRAACGALFRTEGVEVVADLPVGTGAIVAAATLRPHAAIVDVSPADDRALWLAKQLRELECAPTVLLTSSRTRAAFDGALDGFPFVAKADLCTREVVKALLAQTGS